MAHGISDILLGVAINANPFTAGLGTALIHAGFAEVAEGAILQGAGGAIRALTAGGGGRNQASAAQGAGGSSSSDNAAAGSARSGGVQTREINLSEPGGRPREIVFGQVSFPQSSAPQTINVHLSDKETRKWLDDQFNERGVVTIDTARRQHRRVIKQAAQSGPYDTR